CPPINPENTDVKTTCAPNSAASTSARKTPTDWSHALKVVSCARVGIFRVISIEMPRFEQDDLVLLILYYFRAAVSISRLRVVYGYAEPFFHIFWRGPGSCRCAR